METQNLRSEPWPGGSVLPKVSIVLPTYNGSRFLGESIESCLNQTYTDWELIIVDDASTDSTPGIIAKYVAHDSRIRSVRHETNRKLPAALNTGFSKAKGEYLTWTSDDNLYRPQALAAMTAFFNVHPEIDIVYCDYTTIDEEGRPIEHQSVRSMDNLWRWVSVGPCFLYRCIVQKKLGGYAEDLFLGEDYDFWLRASVHFRAQALHDDLYLYRSHDASLTCSYRERILSVREKTQRRNFPRMDWLSNRQRANGHLNTAGRYWEYGDIRGAYRNLIRAVRYSPGCVFAQPRISARLLLGHKVVNLLRYLRKRLVKPGIPPLSGVTSDGRN